MLRLTVQILSLLSLKSLYCIADWLLYPVMYYMIRYRRHIVRLNLTNSFPDKSAYEIQLIEKAFYHHLADVIVEIIHAYRASEEDMAQHITFSTPKQAVELAKQHGGIIVMLGHIGNWEWLAQTSHSFAEYGVNFMPVYRKQKNDSANNLILDIRKRIGGTYCEMNLLLRAMVKNRKEKEPYVYLLISDQKPSKNAQSHTTTFLHQTTPFIVGAEVLAKKFNYPVFFANITQTQRGHYKAELILLSDAPTITEDGEITQAFVHALENNILLTPAQWLWSHNKWRH